MPYTHHPPPGHELVWRAQGDYLQFYYLLWLFGETVRGQAPWFRDPYQFVVPGVTQPVWTYFFPLSPVFFLFSLVSGPFAYNALVLLSFPASGITMTLLARRLGVGWMASCAAGVVFALFPQRLAVLLGGQPTGFGFFLLPLVFLLTEIALARRSLGMGLLAGLTILCLPTVDPHLLYFLGLMSPFYLWLRLPEWVRARPESDQPSRDSVSLALLWAAAIALGLLLGLVAELLPGAPQSGPLTIRLALWLAGLLLLWLAVSESLVLLRGNGWVTAQARALGILSPLVAAFILRGLGSSISVPRLGLVLGLCGIAVSGVLYLRVLGGLGARALVTQLRPVLPSLALAVFAVGYMVYVKQTVLEASVIGGGRSLDEIRLFAPALADLFVRDQPHAARAIYPGTVAVLLAALGVAAGRGRRTAWILTLLFAASVLLSLGPTLRGLPLYDLFHRFVPFGAFIRQPAKFQLVAAFALALLVALGLSRIEAARRGGRWLSAVALMFLLADYAPARSAGLSTLSGHDAIYGRIREEAGVGPVLYLPVWPGESSWSSVYLYATTLIRRPMVNGYAPAVPATYPPTIYRPLDPMNFGEVRDEQYALLRRLGVRAVVFDRGVFPPKVTGLPSAFSLENLQASPFLEFVASENPFWLFRVREHPTGLPVFRRTSPQGIFFEAEWLPRRTGRVEEEPQASGGKILKAEERRDLPGFLHFGPYRALPTGRYVAIFRLKGQGAGAGPFARAEITVDRGRRVLAQRLLNTGDLSPRFADIELHFEMTRPEPLEYRLEWFGQGRMEADYVYVRFAEESDPRALFEVESLAHAMEERADPGASGGVAALADFRSPKAELLSGPYRRYPAGSYQAIFRLKVAEKSLEPVMRLSVTLMPERSVLARTEARGDPDAIGQFREVTLPFRLERPGVIEFGAHYLGRIPIALDRIRVRPIPPR